MNRRHLLAAGIAAAMLIFAGPAPAAAKTLEAVASITVLADVVRQVGGEHVHVRSLVGPNGDAHEYEPTPDDAKNLKAADVVFVSGEGLEGWMDRLITASGYSGKPVVASEGIKTREMEEDGQTIIDPHVWNDPKSVMAWVGNIEKALAAADPEDAEHFKANAEAYRKELQAADDYAREQLSAIPEAQRKLLTSHDAFGYFGRAYHVAFLSPVGFSTENEASAADVARLIDQIKREGVRAYFFENSSDTRLVKQIADATGAQPGGALYVESLSEPDGPAPTYLKMFRYNVDQVVAAMKKTS